MGERETQYCFSFAWASPLLPLPSFTWGCNFPSAQPLCLSPFLNISDSVLHILLLSNKHRKLSVCWLRLTFSIAYHSAEIFCITAAVDFESSDWFLAFSYDVPCRGTLAMMALSRVCCGRFKRRGSRSPQSFANRIYLAVFHLPVMVSGPCIPVHRWLERSDANETFFPRTENARKTNLCSVWCFLRVASYHSVFCVERVSTTLPWQFLDGVTKAPWLRGQDLNLQ